MAKSQELRNQSRDIVLTPLGERVVKLAKIVGVSVVAAAASVGIITQETVSNPTNVSAIQDLEAMDANIDRELRKGPQGKDVILNDGKPFTIGPSNTAADAMIRQDNRADIAQSHIIHLKATTASADSFKPEGIVDANDEALMWQDAELSAEYGRAVLLATPIDRPEL